MRRPPILQHQPGLLALVATARNVYGSSPFYLSILVISSACAGGGADAASANASRAEEEAERGCARLMRKPARMLSLLVMSEVHSLLQTGRLLW